jgi:hypothetical protein
MEFAFCFLVINYSLRYIYLRVYLLTLDLIGLHSFVAACVESDKSEYQSNHRLLVTHTRDSN